MNEKLLQMAREAGFEVDCASLEFWRRLARFAELVRADDRRDAERYRWLRDIGDETWRPFRERTGYSAKQCDEAIDNAIGARGKQEKV